MFILFKRMFNVFNHSLKRMFFLYSHSASFREINSSNVRVDASLLGNIMLVSGDVYFSLYQTKLNFVEYRREYDLCQMTGVESILSLTEKAVGKISTSFYCITSL